MGTISYKQVSTLQRIWDSLTSLVGLKSIGNPLTDSVVIDEDLTLYVETTGNDGNPGTPDKPFKTIQAQLDSLRGKHLKALVTIQIGIGNFQGFHVPTLLQEPKDAIGGDAGLLIQGTMVAPTLTTGTTSGTVTTGGFQSLTDSGQNWTVDELKGKFLFDQTQNAYYVITANTAIQLTLASSVTIVAGHAYSIVTPGSALVSGTKTWSSNPPASTTAALVVAQSLNVNASLTFRALNFDTVTAGIAVGLYLLSNASVARCVFGQASTGAIFGGPAAARSSINTCFFSITTGRAVQFTLLPTFSFSYVRSTNGTPAGIGVLTVGLYAGGLSSNTFENLQVGIDLTTLTSGAFGGAIATQSAHIFKNCTTAVSITGPALLQLATFCSGSGNTNGFVLNRGARLQVGGSATIGATNEIVLDGVNQTLASMRAQSPKLLTNTYGTIIYE